MKKFYLVGAIVIGVLILIAAFAQLGASCTWFLFPSNMPAFLVILQMSALGAVMGGLLILFWKTPEEQEGGGMPGGTE